MLYALRAAAGPRAFFFACPSDDDARLHAKEATVTYDLAKGTAAWPSFDKDEAHPCKLTDLVVVLRLPGRNLLLT